MNPVTNPDRVLFGARLRQQREARSLSVPDIVKITKIPEKSVVHLEDGAFDELPAEVFVRGFLKSYCKAVGLDAEAMLADYHELLRVSGVKPPPSLAKLASSDRHSQQHPAVPAPPQASAAPPSAEGAAKDAAGEPAAVAPVEADKPEEPSIFAALAGAGRSTSRASLTIAVVILVIVATLTLSLLLRRPGHVGDRVSANEHIPRFQL